MCSNLKITQNIVPTECNIIYQACFICRMDRKDSRVHCVISRFQGGIGLMFILRSITETSASQPLVPFVRENSQPLFLGSAMKT